MEIKISKNKIFKHIENISRAISNEYHLPILHYIYFLVDESKITIIASNGTLSIKEVILKEGDNEYFSPGSFLVKGKIFEEVLRKNSGIITFTKVNSELKIDSSNFSAKLKLSDPNLYPQIDFEIEGQELLIDSDVFNDLMSSVSFASSERDYQRMILNGVNLKFKNNELTATATNTFRLARKKTSVNGESEFDVTVLSRDIKSFVPKGARGNLSFVFSNKKIMLNTKSTTIVIKLLDGLYPEVEALLDITPSSVLELDAKDLNHLLNEVTIVSEGLSKTIKLSISKNGFEIVSKKDEVGEVKAALDKYSWSSLSDFEIVCDLRFLRDVVSRLSGEIEIGFIDPHQPIVIKKKNSNKVVHLILPHRTY